MSIPRAKSCSPPAPHHLLWRRGAWRRRFGLQFRHGCLGHDRNTDHRAHELSGNTLTIHGNFTGSIQGLQTTEQGTKLVWANGFRHRGRNCSAYVTNTPTIGFSDASGAAAPYPATGNFVEENVCVQPFVWCKSAATVGAVTNITNITWEQAEYGIPQGRIPLSAWTGKITDTNTFVYLMQRTKDSGTRRCETAGRVLSIQRSGWHLYLRLHQQLLLHPHHSRPLRPEWRLPQRRRRPEAGFNNVNLNWGYGYVGGGDIKNSLNNSSADQPGHRLSVHRRLQGRQAAAQLEQCDFLQRHLADGCRRRHSRQ